MRIIFMGTPDFSVPTLQALHRAGHEIVACYSQPPRPAGRRGLEMVPSPVQRASEELGIPVFTPTSLKDAQEQQQFANLNADVAVVVAYGLLLPQAILDAPVHGCFNGHASLLPRWRGAAPIQRAIMAGDKETGIMVMKMEAGLDTGPVAMTLRLPVDTGMSAGQLHDSLSKAGAELMVEAMTALEAGKLSLTPQDEDGVLYAQKINKQEARIDWTNSATHIQRMVMGLSPFPGAWCEIELGNKLQRVKILKAHVAQDFSEPTEPGTILNDNLLVACGEGTLHLDLLQKAGSKAMDREEFLRGNSVTSGTRLS